MFSPEINDTKTLLADLLNEIYSVSSYSSGVRNTIIGTIPKEPAWIPAVKAEMNLLSDAGGSWMTTYPDNWSYILTCFIDYGTTFSSFSEEIDQNIKDAFKRPDRHFAD